MKKVLSCVLAGLMFVAIAAEARSSYSSGSSSRSSSFSSSRSSGFSSSKSTYSAPKASAPSTSSTPSKSLPGFSKPATVTQQTAPKAAASVQSNSWFSKSAPAPKATTSYSSGSATQKKPMGMSSSVAPIRKVSSPIQQRRSGNTTVVVQRNYYGGNSYGYNRGYGYNRPYYGGGYGGHYGGSSFGDSMMGTMAGMMMFNALTSNHHSGSGNASAVQIEQAKQDQRIEDKLDALKENQDRVGYNNSTPVQSGQVMAMAPVAPQPQCFLPEDAPLVMSPKFYCQPAGK